MGFSVVPSPSRRPNAPLQPSAAAGLRVRGRPIELAIALVLVFGGGVVSAFGDVLAAAGHPLPVLPPSSSGPRRDAGDTAFIAAFALLILLGVCVLIWLGIGWIRYLFLVVAILSVFALAYRAVRDPPLPLALIAAEMVSVASIILLFLPRVNAWMKAVR